MRYSGYAYRRGATVVEVAVVLNVFLLVVLGMVDLTVALFRYNVLCDAARLGARRAIVHGKLAAPVRSVWGPETYTGPGNDVSEIAQAIQAALIGIDPNTVRIDVEWLDGSNEPEDRVRYTVTAPYTLALSWILGGRTFQLAASSTMPIAH